MANRWTRIGYWRTREREIIINAIENDKYDPTLQLAFDLAKQLETTVDELFTPKKKSK